MAKKQMDYELPELGLLQKELKRERREKKLLELRFGRPKGDR